MARDGPWRVTKAGFNPKAVAFPIAISPGDELCRVALQLCPPMLY
jgi:hypothetical protein